MKQYDFNILLEKYLAGNCTHDEEAFIEHWCEKNAFEDTFLLSDDKKSETKERIWTNIKAHNFHKKPWFYQWRSMGIAASILICLSLGLYFAISPFDKKELSNTNDDIEVKNNSTKAQEITLEDGSVVQLQPNSKISYPEHFGDINRHVYLTGEAKFDVKRNPEKPFLVFTDKVTTEVLGTSFIIKSGNKSKSIEIEVLTGKVSVYENTEKKSKIKNGAVLTPNQKIIFNKETKAIEVGIVEKPNIIESKNQHEFDFDDTPLPAVLEVFKKNYKLDIFIENHDLHKCVFTADLNGLPMFTQLDFICKTINAQYEIRGTNIFIFGEGCGN